MKPAILILLGAVSAAAQPFSAGVKVGLPMTDFINTVSGQSSTVFSRRPITPQILAPATAAGPSRAGRFLHV